MRILYIFVLVFIEGFANLKPHWSDLVNGQAG